MSSRKKTQTLVRPNLVRLLALPVWCGTLGS